MSQKQTIFTPLDFKECVQDIRVKVDAFKQRAQQTTPAFQPLDFKECVENVRAKVDAMMKKTI
ncbi:hypothetical protein [Hydromonas duriensis]|uniref:Uncharacterized protein n=1 Tax=Hydromonas duriensis TaxID=1527608 RepID=A0A4V3DK48_9BURK|nr:hypothetical protein [Hydromonas duriensis]TDR32707.1 hypothetical protein DFR44_1023 [Hydromonas duriensis]